SAEAAPLPPVCAPPRAARRLHDRIRVRPVARRRGAARRAPDAPAECPTSLREGAHGGARAVRAGVRTAQTPPRLGAARRAGGERAAAARRGRPVGPGPEAANRRPPRLLEAQGTPGRA